MGARSGYKKGFSCLLQTDTCFVALNLHWPLGVFYNDMSRCTLTTKTYQLTDDLVQH